MGQENGKMFLYKQLYTQLKEKILSGEYPSLSLLPSEREIGLANHVDRITVRRALQMLVEENLVQKQPGKGTLVIYGKPASQSALKSASIAFFLPKSARNSDRITQPFYASLFYGVQKECQRRGYSVIYSTLDEQDDFDAIVSANDFAGIFFVSNVSRAHIARALERKIPSVLINGYDERLPSVLSDNFTGTYLACRHLIKRGHKEIGVIKGVESYVTSIERLRGCVTALYEAGLALKNAYILGGDSWEVESGFEAVNTLIKSQKKLPTAFVAFNDRLALGAIQALMQAGVRVPQDVSVTGFDNSEQAKYALPKITTVEIHLPMLAKAAVSNLFGQMVEHVSLPAKLLIPVELVEQDSVSDR